MLELNNKQIKLGLFPNRETYIEVDNITIDPLENTIKIKFESDSDIFQLYCLNKHIREIAPSSKIKLIMPYIPYSRSDRNQEERLYNLKHFASYINDLNFDTVEVIEPHSKKSSYLLNHLIIINKSMEIANKVIRQHLDEEIINGIGVGAWSKENTGVYLVLPDKGALERYQNKITHNKLLVFRKNREINTGNIIKTELDTDMNMDISKCKTAIIVDDLCCYGSTFINIGKKLKELGVNRVELVVAHCENAIFEGNLLKNEIINKVYTTNSILDVSKCEDKSMLNKLVVENI